MTATAFIPARKGSKRLPGKNKKLFHGKPLVQWSIDQAKESKLFDIIVVSSDDDDILEIADKSGVTPVQRQPQLAEDETDISDVVYDYFARPENVCDYVCLLNPTHPLRSVKDLKESHRFIKMKKYNAVVSVVWNDILGWVGKPTKDGPGCLYLIDKRPTKKSRDDWYLENGCIYWCKHEVITNTGTFIGGPNQVKLYEMPKERSLEIDDAFDWFLCEKAYEWSHK
jgi:CMP-N,N'-diacetyllegionaminic acid synthase